MRNTLRILTITASILVFSGALTALPGCGPAQDEQVFKADDPAITKSRQAREEYAKSEKKATARHASGRGTDPRG